MGRGSEQMFLQRRYTDGQSGHEDVPHVFTQARATVRHHLTPAGCHHEGRGRQAVRTWSWGPQSCRCKKSGRKTHPDGKGRIKIVFPHRHDLYIENLRSSEKLAGQRVSPGQGIYDQYIEINCGLVVPETKVTIPYTIAQSTE